MEVKAGSGERVREGGGEALQVEHQPQGGRLLLRQFHLIGDGMQMVEPENVPLLLPPLHQVFDMAFGEESQHDRVPLPQVDAVDAAIGVVLRDLKAFEA